MESMTLPHNPEVEAVFLGTLIRGNVMWSRVAGMLTPDDFFVPEHIAIYEQLASKLDKGEEANAATMHVSESIREYLWTLYANVINPRNIQDYAHQIRDMAEKRRIISACMTAMERCYENEFDDTAMGIGSELSAAVSLETRVTDLRHIKDIAGSITDGLKEPQRRVSTGIEALDKVLGGGLYNGKLYGFGGRMKGGKSLMMKTIAFNIAREGLGCAYITLEDTGENLGEALLARMMNANAMAFKDERNRNDPGFVARCAEAARLFEDMPLEILERPRMSLNDLRSNITRLAMRKDIEGIFVDYMQLVSGRNPKATEAAHLDEVAQCLAEATKQFGVWIVTAVQMNRDNGVRGGDGLLAGCDAALVVHKIDDEYSPSQPGMWLEMKVSRYVPACDVGGPESPALMIDKVGPHIRETISGIQRERMSA